MSAITYMCDTSVAIPLKFILISFEKLVPPEKVCTLILIRQNINQLENIILLRFNNNNNIHTLRFVFFFFSSSEKFIFFHVSASSQENGLNCIFITRIRGVYVYKGERF